MATLRSRAQTVLSKYKSIARPKTTGGSTFSTFAKKQQAAEDAIIDNQYSDGLISAEFYQSELTKRASRVTNTPLQLVNLQQKIGDVGQAVQDAKVKTQYDGGQISTAQYLAYQKQKLATITEPNSTAYQNQQSLVQNLQDKMEKENRAATRNQELNRISLMPEDTSESLYAKAELYQKLSQQAALDGDNQTALTLQTSYNNAVNSAKRASINDEITQIRLDNSSLFPTGLGVPNSAGGASILGGGLSTPSSGNGSNFQGGGVTTGAGGSPVSSVSGSTSSGSGFAGSSAPSFSSYGNSGALGSALKRIDSIQNTYERTYQNMSKQSAYVDKIGEILNRTGDGAVTGDQRTALEIQYNNARNSVVNLSNDLDNITQNFEDAKQRYYDAQAAAAKSAFSKWKSNETAAMNLEANNLEKALKQGKISKEDYLAESSAFVIRKQNLLQEVANGYRNFGEDDKADVIEQKDLVDLQGSVIGKLANTLSQIKNPDDIYKTVSGFGNDFELIRIDKNGALDSVTGAVKNKGDISLQDVAALKENGTFDQKYIKDGNVFSPMHFGKQIDPLTDKPLGISQIKDLVAQGKGAAPTYLAADGTMKKIGILEFQNADGTTKQLFKTQNDLMNDPVLKRYVVAQPSTNKNNTTGKSDTLFTLNLPKVTPTDPGAAALGNTVLALRKVPGLEMLGNGIVGGAKVIGDAVSGVSDFITGKKTPAKTVAPQDQGFTNFPKNSKDFTVQKTVAPKIELPVQQVLNAKKPVVNAMPNAKALLDGSSPASVSPSLSSVSSQPVNKSVAPTAPVASKVVSQSQIPNFSSAPGVSLPSQSTNVPSKTGLTFSPAPAKVSTPTVKPAPNIIQQAVSNVSKAAAPVVSTISNVVSGIGNFLNNLNPFKKK